LFLRLEVPPGLHEGLGISEDFLPELILTEAFLKLGLLVPR
jgi:hypothetical protein